MKKPICFVLSFFLLTISLMANTKIAFDTPIDLSIGDTEFMMPILLNNSRGQSVVIWLAKDATHNTVAIYASRLEYKSLWTYPERLSSPDENVLPGFEGFLNDEGMIIICWNSLIEGTRHVFSIVGNVTGEWQRKIDLS